MPVDKWITPRGGDFSAIERKQNLWVLFPGASSLTRGFALSLGCGEHCWLDHIRGRKLDIQPIRSSSAGCEGSGLVL